MFLIVVPSVFSKRTLRDGDSGEGLGCSSSFRFRVLGLRFRVLGFRFGVFRV